MNVFVSCGWDWLKGFRLFDYIIQIIASPVDVYV